jgi:hypothetical protein
MPACPQYHVFPKDPKGLAIECIRIFPDQYPSKNAFFNRILCQDTNGWDNGVPICDSLLEDYVVERASSCVTLEKATGYFLYGDQNLCFMFSPPSSERCHILNIPADVDPAWLEVIEQFCWDVNRIVLDTYKLYVYSHYAFAKMSTEAVEGHYRRAINDFEELRKVTNQLCIDRGWHYATVERNQDKYTYPDLLAKVVASLGDHKEGQPTLPCLLNQIESLAKQIKERLKKETV